MDRELSDVHLVAVEAFVGLTPDQVARCELLEEVGGTAADLRYIGQFYASNGISNEVAYVYLATGVGLGEAQPEPTELMEVRLVPVEEALSMARSGEISDGPSALALLWCERQLQLEPHRPRALETDEKR